MDRGNHWGNQQTDPSWGLRQQVGGRDKGREQLRGAGQGCLLLRASSGHQTLEGGCRLAGILDRPCRGVEGSLGTEGILGTCGGRGCRPSSSPPPWSPPSSSSPS